MAIGLSLEFALLFSVAFRRTWLPLVYIGPWVGFIALAGRVAWPMIAFLWNYASAWYDASSDDEVDNMLAVRFMLFLSAMFVGVPLTVFFGPQWIFFAGFVYYSALAYYQYRRSRSAIFITS